LEKQNLEFSVHDEKSRKWVPKSRWDSLSREGGTKDVQVRPDKEMEYAWLYDKLLHHLLKAHEPEMFLALFNEIKESISSSLFTS
jgi:hypothetical protein